MIVIAKRAAGVFGICLGAAAIVLQIGLARTLAEAHEIWRSGATASDVLVGERGHRSTDFLDRGEERLTVSYSDQKGARHTVVFGVWALNTPIDDTHPAVVKYAIEAPDRAALSWLQDIEAHRWGQVVFGTAIALGVMVLSRRLIVMAQREHS